MTAVAVQTNLFEHGRTFVQCFTIFLYSTNCTQFRKFSRLSKCSNGPGGGQLSACPSARRQGPKAKLLPFTSQEAFPRWSPVGEEPLPGSGQSFSTDRIYLRYMVGFYTYITKDIYKYLALMYLKWSIAPNAVMAISTCLISTVKIIKSQNIAKLNSVL